MPLLARDDFRTALEAPPNRMLGRLADASAALMGRAARLLAVGEAVGPDDPVLAAVRARWSARSPARCSVMQAAADRRRNPQSVSARGTIHAWTPRPSAGTA